MKILNKKLLASVLSVFLFSNAFAEMTVLAGVNVLTDIPIQNDESKALFSKFDPSIGGQAFLEFRPFPFLGIFGNGTFSHFNQKSDTLTGYNFFEASAGAKFVYPVIDRITLTAGASVGMYRSSHIIVLGNNSFLSDETDGGFSGISFEIGGGAEFRILPWLNANLNVGYHSYTHSDFPVSGIRISTGFSMNFREAFNPKNKLSVELSDMAPVFPVLYSWYNENSFGTVNILNGEDTSITDVDVYFYCEQYMNQKKFCGQIPKIKKGETASVNLTAFFNESTLKLLERINANSIVILEYKKLGQKKKAEIPVSLSVYHRNAMSWEDDRRAAVFVSPNDEEAKSFAMQTASVVRHHLVEGVNENLQYAAALFEALNLYGMNYVVDPTSAYADNVGSTSVDFLQFPHQSLNYRGGDCDDLSILFSSVLEALGIESAFITVPGHIYCAFNTGLTEEEARQKFTTDILIISEDRAWIPVEITMIKDGFNAAVRYGATEWKKAAANNNAAIYPMHSSWESYKTVTAPGADSDVYVPSRAEILSAFNRQMRYNY